MKKVSQIFRQLHYINRGLASLLLVLFTATLLSVAYFIYSLLTLNSLIDNGSRAVTDVYVLQDLYTNIQQAESSDRGMALTGDSQYLTSYNQAIKTIPQDLQLLDKQATFSNLPEYPKFKQAVQAKLGIMQQLVTNIQSGAVDPVSLAAQVQAGEQSMGTIRKLVNVLATNGTSTIQPKEMQAKNNLHSSLILACVLIFYLFALCIIILIYFQKAIFKERALEGAKSEFLSLASHQLRTPATNVKQYLGLLTEGYLGKLSKQQKEALEVANRNNNAEIDIINGILNITKLDLNRIQLDLKPTDMLVIAQQVAEEHRLAAEAKKQIIAVKCEHKKVLANVDELYIKNALENLVDNACKYSPDNTTVTISIAKSHDNKVEVAVHDEGVGISKADISKLFKKFSRLPLSANNVQGSGLGLYWVKRIVELHGGTISAHSRKGKGSTFRMLLPA